MHAPTPSEPRPCAHCAPSPTRCSRLPASLYAAIEQIRNRRPGRCHREVPSASPSSRPPRAAARVPLSHCVGPGALAGKNRTVCIPFSPNARKGPLPGNIRPKCMLFEIKMATSSPYASISERNRAIRDTWRANLAAKGPFSRRGARNHAWREDVASAVRPFRGSGMRHAAWPNGLCALRRGPGLLAACAPPAISLVSAAARVHRRRLIRVALRRPHRVHRAQSSAAPPIAVGVSCRSGSSCRPRAAHADASRPPMRARRHRLGPNPRQPSPSPAPTEPQPRANRVPTTRGAVCAHPRPATRRASPCRAGSAAVPVIPAKWCGDTIAHTRKLRF